SPDGQSVRPYVFGQYSNSFTNSQSGGPEYHDYTQAFARGPDGAEVVQRSFFGAVKYDVSETFSLRAQGIAGRTESNEWDLRGQMTIAGPQYAYIIHQEDPSLPAAVRDEMVRTGRETITV